MQAGTDSIGGWQAFHADRTERLNAATDDALRKHFEAELDVARTTLQAMGIEVPDAGVSPSDIPQENNAVEQPGVTAPRGDDPADQAQSPATENSGDSKALRPNLNPQLDPFRDEILAASEATGIAPNLLAAVIWDESKGVVSAGSINGENGMTDCGLMQLNPETFADMKAKNPDLITGDSSDARSNIMAGAMYLKEMHDQFGDWDFALRAYNSGPLSVDMADASISTTGFGTKNYVEKVNFYRETLDQGNVMPDGFPGGNQLY